MRKALIVVAVVVLIAIAVIASMLHHGFSAHDEPTAMESFLAGVMRRAAVPAELKRAKNPVPLTPAVLAEARAHFADHCALCHGNDGKGKTELGRNLYPRVPDMTLPSTQSQSDGEVFATIENGVRMTGMPAWGNGSAASRRASWALVHFIRHLPKLTPRELEEMKSLNPMTPAEMKEQREEEEFLEGK